MNTLGVSNRDRAISRICFYLLVGFVMWTTNRLVPQGQQYGIQVKRADAEEVHPLIAVPLSDLSFVPGVVAR